MEMNAKLASMENGQSDDMTKTLEGHYEHIEAAESARQALLGRRHFSLRIQIFLGFLMVFLFAVGIAAVLLATMYQVEEKLRVLEVVNDFEIEIQQARRFEKNFFLYGTNLSDALENVYRARDVFDRNAKELAPILTRAGKGTVPLDIDLYESLLKRLVELEQDPTKNQKYLKDVKEIELALRQHGQKMVSFAQDLMNREKEAVAHRGLT